VTPERWERFKAILSLALRYSPRERAEVIDRESGADDPSMRREIEELLKSHDEMGTFLEEPVFNELSPLEEVPSELAQWDRYQVLERLGSGGMAAVYKAWDPRLQRLLAIKIISARDELTVRRFLREAEAQARVAHDNVLDIYETGAVGQCYYIAMQYVNGPTLLGIREETTVEHKVRLMVEITEGLHAAHRQGLVHRDIKPTNILIERSAEGLKPYLLDFGLAAELGAPSLTKTGVVLGTPRYMAPERITSGTSALDRRSDIYSLGATFYELIAGVVPFAGSSALGVLVDVVERDLAPLRSIQPALAPELDAIVMKCLEKEPSHRYPSARSLADDLQRYLDGEPVLARPAGTLARLAKRARKYPRLTIAFAVMLILTLVLTGWGAYGYWRSSRQSELAQRLGQDVRDLDWLFRVAQMSPLHPIESHKLSVRRRMTALERTMDDVGSLAFGPGHDALGHASLTLRENHAALGHLEQAWRSGYRTADTASALGLAHAEIFREELAKAQRIEVAREREDRIKALQVAHRDPALRFLAEGRSSSLMPTRYDEALIASLEGDVRAAIEKGEQAAREVPWLFEARLLQAHLELDEGVRLYLNGNAEKAVARAMEADRYYALAERVAESSVDVHLGRCAVSGLLLHMGVHGIATDVATAHRQAEQSCSRALVVEPHNAEGHRLYSDAMRAWGNFAIIQNSDPGNAHERSVEFAERAMHLSGGELETVLSMADAFMDLSWRESKRNSDPRPTIDRAIATYEKALDIDRRNLTVANNMGQALVLRSRYEIAHDLDASRSQDQAVASFQRAVTLDPESAFGFRNLTRATIARANEHARRGIDPAPGLSQVIRFLEKLNGNAAFPDRVEALFQLRSRLSLVRETAK
jgi:serine/threonine-protein kinase